MGGAGPSAIAVSSGSGRLVSDLLGLSCCPTGQHGSAGIIGESRVTLRDGPAPPLGSRKLATASGQEDMSFVTKRLGTAHPFHHPRVRGYEPNSAFQYASLINLDQLFIVKACSE